MPLCPFAQALTWKARAEVTPSMAWVSPAADIFSGPVSCPISSLILCSTSASSSASFPFNCDNLFRSFHNGDLAEHYLSFAELVQDLDAIATITFPLEYRWISPRSHRDDFPALRRIAIPSYLEQEPRIVSSAKPLSMQLVKTIEREVVLAYY